MAHGKSWPIPKENNHHQKNCWLGSQRDRGLFNSLSFNKRRKLMKTKKYLGNGLALYESEKGTHIWRMKYTFEGRGTSLSLGLACLIDESEAIKRCEECRILIAMGKNPRDHRSWLKPKAEYAKEYLIVAIEKKVQELLNLVEIMKKQS